MKAPAPNELEVSVFGPGVGECVVCHLGAEEWAVIDSCVVDGNPIALTYLDELGIDVSRQVKLVLITHWHDDHVRGAHSVLERATSAQFACSAALNSKEFYSLLATAQVGGGSELHTSGLDEMIKVLTVQRSRRGRPTPDHWATDGKLLLRADNNRSSIHALSPSADTITISYQRFAQMMPAHKHSVRRIPNPSPNDVSVAAQLTRGGRGVLLGADLETVTDKRRGWHAVVDSKVKPQERSCVFKIAHHGSPNGHCEEVWTEMLINDAHAIVTPYGSCRPSRPSNEDIDRLHQYASSVYCTTYPPTAPAPPRQRAVDRTLREVSTYRRAIKNKPGQVCVRMTMLDDGSLAEPVFTLVNGAVKLPAPTSK